MTNTPSPDEDRELKLDIRMSLEALAANEATVDETFNDITAVVLSDRAKLEEALEFYADPENYHAISFMCDQPCGSFEDDFDENHGHEDYDIAMPGKRARAALNRYSPCDIGRS